MMALSSPAWWVRRLGQFFKLLAGCHLGGSSLAGFLVVAGIIHRQADPPGDPIGQPEINFGVDPARVAVDKGYCALKPVLGNQRHYQD